MDGFQEQDYNSKFDLGIWKEIFKYTKGCRSAVIQMFITAVVLAIVDTVFPMFSGYAIDNFIVAKNIDNYSRFGFGFFALILVQVFLIFNFIRLAGVIEASIQKDTREAGFRKLQELSFAYFDKTPGGWIVARMGSDVQKLGSMIAWGLIDLIWGIFLIIFLIIAMFLLNAQLALIIIAMMPIIAGLGFYFQRKILAGHRESRKVNSKITAGFSEGIIGAKTTKTLVREDGNMEEFFSITNDMKTRTIRVHILSSIFLPLVTFVGSAGAALVLTAGSNEVKLGVITIGTLSIFINYTTKLFEPINNIARIFSEMQSAQASAERIFSLINEESEVSDLPEVIEKYGSFDNPKYENFEKLIGDVEFKNVEFKYTNGETVLNNFNLKIKAGQKIAFIGETGSGKSTIINLISRFYEPTSGELLIDGIDYRKRSQSWLHSNLSYVMQQPHMFAGTIRENIAYGKLDATDEEIIEAAKKVNAYDFIMKMENGFDSEVGEGGSRLSQGEKQLVSFARAIIGNPKLFILDEATSSIDTVTERNIQNAIDTALKGITSFIVAHRLSTIKDADRIIVINKGVILEDGSHEELLAKKEHYYKLYMKQFTEDEYAKLVGVRKEGLL